MVRNGIRAIALAAVWIVAFGQIAAAQPAANGSGLWVGGQLYISEFQGKALKTSGKPAAGIAFGSPDFSNPSSMAFDSHNNLWIGFFEVAGRIQNQPVVGISRADIAALLSGALVKPIILHSRGGANPFATPFSIAFDAAGDLWVSSEGQKTGLVELTPKQIAKSGAPTPTIFITEANFVPTAIRFDGSDNLWVTRFQSGTTLQQFLRFAPGDRAASGAPNPGLTVDIPNGLHPVDLAFDGSGNLWTAGVIANNEVVEMFSAGDLSGSGEISPTPAVSITSTAFGGPFAGPCIAGIDFDRAGDLWVSTQAANGCSGVNQIVEFTPSQLSGGGDLTPSVVLAQNRRKTNFFSPGPIRFGPTLP
jgi:hypothetical protein